jgi:hypothetical protein
LPGNPAKEGVPSRVYGVGLKNGVHAYYPLFGFQGQIQYLIKPVALLARIDFVKIGHYARQSICNPQIPLVPHLDNPGPFRGKPLLAFQGGSHLH